MTAEEFWEDDPNLFVAYRTSFVNKMKREKEKMNYDSWLNGLYIYNANTIINNNLITSIGRMFFKHGKYSNNTYPSKPYDLEEKDNTTDVKGNKIAKEKEYFNKYNYFATMKKRFIDKIKKGE